MDKRCIIQTMENVNKKNKIITILKGILVILWMIIVFLLSNQPAEESSITSGNTIRYIVKTVYKDVTPEKLESFVESSQYIVRKIAHFTLYTIGGFLLYNYTYENDQKSKRKLAILIGVVYAITDEIHQHFVPGRACMLLDVFIDSLGVVLGVFIYSFVKSLCKSYLKNKKV